MFMYNFVIKLPRYGTIYGSPKSLNAIFISFTREFCLYFLGLVIIYYSKSE